MDNQWNSMKNEKREYEKEGDCKRLDEKEILRYKKLGSQYSFLLTILEREELEILQKKIKNEYNFGLNEEKMEKK